MSNQKRNNMTEKSGIIRLSFRCTGLQCSPTASFHAGMLTGLLNRAKGSTSAKNEKRAISVALSKGMSGEFCDVYRSETIDDAFNISPSLVADIICKNAAESIRMRILYSSNLSGGKEVIVGEATVSLSDILSAGSMTFSLSSQFLKEKATLAVKIVERFRPVLMHSAFAPIAAPNPGNPYCQSYLFYHEENGAAPAVYCEEYGLETRISGYVVTAFLDECLRTLSVTKNAWIARRKFEKIRQGHFTSLGEALKNGWHQVTISVLGAKIPTDIYTGTVQKSTSMPLMKDNDSIIDFCAGADTNSVKKTVGTRNDLKKAIHNFSQGCSKRMKSLDDFKPSTFVEIEVSRSNCSFTDPVGYTNAEYFCDNPVYGSNLNSSSIKHPYTEHQRGRDCVTLLTEPRTSNSNLERDSEKDKGGNFAMGMDRQTSSGARSVGNSPQRSRDNRSMGSRGDAEDSSVKFVSYIPTCSGTMLSFTLHQVLGDVSHSASNNSSSNNLADLSRTMADRGKSIAHFTVPADCPTLSKVTDNAGFSRRTITSWVAENSVGGAVGDTTSGMQLLVSIEILSPLHVVGSKSDALDASQNMAGERHISTCESRTPSDILKGCREFELQLGYDATDPLELTDQSTLSPLYQTELTQHKIKSSSRNNAMGEADLLSFDDDDSGVSDADVSMVSASLTSRDVSPLPNRHVNSNEEMDALRVDYDYPPDWLDSHIQQIELLSRELLIARNNAQDLLDKNGAFRPSTAKKIMTHQAVPVNLHMQVLTVRAMMLPGTLDPSRPDDPPMEDVLDAMTCGCLSPHGLGFTQKKGLDAMESSLNASRARMDGLKKLLEASIQDSRSRNHTDDVLTTDRNISSSHNYATAPLLRRSPAFALYERIGAEVLTYETDLLSTCRRRTFAVSQAVSIAVSAVLMKLTLIAEKHIPEEVCVGWLTHGFLLVFEGLLSVIGSERFMLEDTVSAIEALSQFQVCILPLDEKEQGTKREGSNYLNDLIRFEADQAHGEDRPPVVEVGIMGKEVMLYMPSDALAALPEEFQTRARNGGAVLRIVAALFSQGIDMQQTLALAATSFSAMASQATTDKSKVTRPLEGGRESPSPVVSEDLTAMKNLQHVVNVRGLALLEGYCCSFRPVEGDREGLSATGGVNFEPSAAAAVKEQHDRFRSSQSSSARNGQSRAAATTRNLSMAMSLTSAATSAAGSAVRAYGASYFKSGGGASARSERGSRTTGSSLNTPTSPMPLSSHPLLEELTETILANGNINSKNVEMLVAVERVCVMLGGCRVTFCKSGKDRTGMAVTYEQSRQLGERFGCGQSMERVLRDANVMRIHGVRIMIAEKNIGRRVYSINQLQVQFLPTVYRPPKEVLEGMMRKDDT